MSIPLGDGKYVCFVEDPKCRVESNGTFHAITADDAELPGFPVEKAEVDDDGFQCPASRGRLVPHTRVKGECRHALDEANVVDNDLEDALFLGESEAEEEP